MAVQKAMKIIHLAGPIKQTILVRLPFSGPATSSTEISLRSRLAISYMSGTFPHWVEPYKTCWHPRQNDTPGKILRKQATVSPSAAPVLFPEQDHSYALPHSVQ